MTSWKLWDLLEGTELFNVIKAEESGNPGEYDELLHFAQITSLLGPQPAELASGRRASMFYRPNGKLQTLVWSRETDS